MNTGLLFKYFNSNENEPSGSGYFGPLTSEEIELLKFNVDTDIQAVFNRINTALKQSFKTTGVIMAHCENRMRRIFLSGNFQSWRS